MKTGIPGVDQLIEILVYGGLSLMVAAFVMLWAETRERRYGRR
jgi:hypothetical protein